MKSRKEFCIYCKCDCDYEEKKITEAHTIKDVSYNFLVTRAICSKCGHDMGLPKYLDYNREEVSCQYRDAEGLVQIQDIKDLISLYDLGKSTLSIVLGFGEITITRYLDGQIPSKSYSNIIKKALASPEYMEKAIAEHEDDLTDTAYYKSMFAADVLLDAFSMSPKMMGAIALLFKYLDEITPMALQKMLYYSDGLYAAKYKKPLFSDVCEAWALGPVYHDAYKTMKSLLLDTQKDARFSIIRNNISSLSQEEMDIIKLVAMSFGKYSGVVLSEITHEEKPWKIARGNLEEGAWSNESISKKEMAKYFAEVDAEYGINAKGLNKYIDVMIKRVYR